MLDLVTIKYEFLTQGGTLEEYRISELIMEVDRLRKIEAAAGEAVKSWNSWNYDGVGTEEMSAVEKALITAGDGGSDG